MNGTNKKAMDGESEDIRLPNVTLIAVLSHEASPGFLIPLAPPWSVVTLPMPVL